MELAVSIEEAARRAGVGRTTIYEAVNDGKLVIRKSGRRSLVLVDELQNWLSSLPRAEQKASTPEA